MKILTFLGMALACSGCGMNEDSYKVTQRDACMALPAAEYCKALNSCYEFTHIPCVDGLPSKALQGAG